MKLTRVIKETEVEIALHRATDKALKKFNKAKQPHWNICLQTIACAWKEYEKAIAPLEQTCNNEIARASRRYTKETNTGELK